MLLSFIVPVYNNAAAFAQCHRSLLPLVGRGIAEIVAVDDGSVVPLVPDGYEVRLLRTDHRGAAAARNAGIETAKGEFVWFVDADDEISTDAIDSLLADLQAMDPSVPLFHIGPMVAVSSPGQVPQPVPPDRSATRTAVPLQLLAPRCSIADHTTNILRRSWLLQHPEVRYREDMALLEDTVFSLKVIESAASCLCNDTYRFYRHHTYHPSSTSGAWSAARSERFTGDVCRFFVFLQQYAAAHSDCPQVAAYYERMRYVYLRVMAVKGCPRANLVRLIDVVGAPRRTPRFVYFLFTFLCRKLRRLK